ncbi:putative toxin-antitoxin system toxin component, PIN family [Candidatus Oleimmundimicrobium sp.]|uniref:putative toxin-antitoxin system toxin component, PIN family n=1 Tax=Candidatus Oleimmundimicrobium sp. TaxID=3060597 RepID=UPI00271DEB26|nr:putative toxin-antitoxin system toxin component, PIN family [Candidatus Oleimmundimicrobium sp.]MDO8886450.1 putative toxin-antitoxin system toxin component, PIN family [Candidatus Oleimmundimicrobium sp.]
MPERSQVVLDTNVLISGVLFGGTSGEIIKLWRERAFELAISPETLAELIEKLKFKFGLPSELVNEWQNLLSERGIHVIPNYNTKICRDPDDDKFIDVALAARAGYLVIGDKDLLVLKSYREVKFLKPKEFLALMRK